MRLPAYIADLVLRHGIFARLQPFLQSRFGIFARRYSLRADVHIGKQAPHQGFGHCVAGIQVHRADQGFQRIGQNGRTIQSARTHLAFAQAQGGRQIQLERNAV